MPGRGSVLDLEPEGVDDGIGQAERLGAVPLVQLRQGKPQARGDAVLLPDQGVRVLERTRRRATTGDF